MTRCMRLSSVKVPRPASPFITHETPIYSEGRRLLYLVAMDEIDLFTDRLSGL